MSTRVAILGANGYGGGELLRLLLAHPAVEVTRATSRSAVNVPVASVHKNLLGLTDLEFSAFDPDDIQVRADVVIGALPHGASAEILGPLYDSGMPIVDLSGDFRLRDAEAYKRWYKRAHPRPDLLSAAVYGAPEVARDAIREARLIASPGCFATALNLAMLPAAQHGWTGRTVNVVAMTGSSGSGATASAGTHHPTRATTLRPYKVLAHQHVPEVVQCVRDAGGALEAINFVPVSAPLVRGILAVVTLVPEQAPSSDEAEHAYRSFHASHPFVKTLTSREPECAAVAHTNYAEVRVRRGENGELVVIAAIDNLVKGGAGQAVQNLNLSLGLDESTGLEFTGSWP